MDLGRILGDAQTGMTQAVLPGPCLPAPSLPAFPFQLVLMVSTSLTLNSFWVWKAIPSYPATA